MIRIAVTTYGEAGETVLSEEFARVLP